MLDPEMIAKLEQAAAAMLEVAPVLSKQWKALYDGCMNEGFTAEQSMQLVKAYILSQNPHGIRGAD